MKDIKNVGSEFIKDMNIEQCTNLEKMVALEMLRLCLGELAKVHDNIHKFGDEFKGSEKENIITSYVMYDMSEFDKAIMEYAGYWSNDIEYNLKKTLEEKKIDSRLINDITDEHRAKSKSIYDNIYEWLAENFDLKFRFEA